MTTANPWAHRFVHLLDASEIRRLASRNPEPLVDLSRHPASVSTELLKQQFEKLFVATDQVVAILLTLIEEMHAHALFKYKNLSHFMSEIYSESQNFSEQNFPICFTGPAGVGKSHLISAFQRIVASNSSIVVDPSLPELPFDSYWYLKVGELNSVTKILQSLLDKPRHGSRNNAIELLESTQPKDITRLLKKCRKSSYLSGVSILVADEFQFVTRSEQANSLITSILLTLAEIYLPTVFVCNYSLGHRLQRRPVEDKQRLLSRPLILLPDTADSEDWVKTVQGYMSICPVAFKIDVEKEARNIHGWTAGINRSLKILLILAYKISRARKSNSVTVSDLEVAYKSIEYSIHRDDINAISKQNLSVVAPTFRKDLWCPFDLPKSVTSQSKRITQEKKEILMGEALLKSALSPDEKSAYERLQKSENSSQKKRINNVTHLNKNVGVSVEEFMRGEELFRKKE